MVCQIESVNLQDFQFPDPGAATIHFHERIEL